MMETGTNSCDFSAVILAAGKSVRMKTPKFSLLFSENQTFTEHLVHQLNKAGCKQIVVVLNEDGALLFQKLNPTLSSNTSIAINAHPEWNRFFSIKTGLQALQSKNPVFIVNVDNPFLTPELVKILLSDSKNAEAVFPEYNGKGGHPLLLTQTVVQDILNEKNHQIDFREFMAPYKRKGVKIQDKNVLVNINTPEDYKANF